MVMLMMPLVAVVACGGDDSETATPAEPPWCLAEVAVPDTDEAVVATFEAMPGEFGGYERRLTRDLERINITYEEALEGTPSIQAIPMTLLRQVLPQGDLATPVDYLDLLAAAAEEPAEAGGVSGSIDEVSPTSDENVVWGTGTTTQDDIVASSMMFAAPDGEWVFTLIAPSPDDRVALLDAFCEAAPT